MSEDLSTGSGP